LQSLRRRTTWFGVACHAEGEISKATLLLDVLTQQTASLREARLLRRLGRFLAGKFRVLRRARHDELNIARKRNTSIRCEREREREREKEKQRTRGLTVRVVVLQRKSPKM